mmetsp:Transcript_3013/g.4408  ORF Transcript_3013/g.4408 Transcript_3013/m.4408 type:complete len:336 (-) Transcript_3013:56-1063(-)
MSTSLFFNFEESYSCEIHPVVIFTILDHFVRRDEKQNRVVGTLLGIFKDNVIEVRNCFAVPHEDNNSPNGVLDMSHHRSMLDLYLRSNPKESVVGWYATGSDINRQSRNYHTFFRREMQRSPLHLLVDTDLKGKTQLDIQAFMSNEVSFTERSSLGSLFQPIQMSLGSFGSDKIGMQQLLNMCTTTNLDATASSSSSSSSSPLIADQAKLASNVEHIQSNFNKLLQQLDDVIAYVDAQTANPDAKSQKIGRFLSDAVSSLPQVDPDQFHKLFNNSLQDLLMVVYLANLTRAQTALASKLQMNAITTDNDSNSSSSSSSSSSVKPHKNRQSKQTSK